MVKQQAIAFLATKGFEGFTVNKLAKLCGISIATLYIYYKDKDDLIIQIAREEITRLREFIMEGVNPDKANFEDGLRTQWHNRYTYLMNNPVTGLFLEQLRTSSYQDAVYSGFRDDHADAIARFMKNAIDRGEIAEMPLEVYWALAFSPLMTLIRAHNEGKRTGGKPFLLTEEIVWKTFDLVKKALKR